MPHLTNACEEAGRAKRAFLAAMRHDLRTPLNAIIGYSEMLLEEVADPGGPDEASLAPDLRRILDCGQEVLNVVNAILDPATIAADRNPDLVAFGGRISHQMRTPLNTIIGYSELLLEEGRDLARASLRADLERIDTAARILLDRIDDAATLCQFQAGRIRVDLMEVDAAARAAVSTIRSLDRDEASGAEANHGSLLVVDDHEANRALLSRRLERLGYTIALAENGRRALEMIRAGSYDLVLLDLLMPEMNGYEVLEILKSDEALRHLPVIMISAQDEIDSVVRCIEMGAEDFLPKPFNPVLLRARIGAVLEKKWLRDREQEYLAQLRVEREKSERLLLNILPHTIAARLRESHEIIADSFPAATVLFCDLVGFSRIVARASPTELVHLLNTIFTTFDSLVARYGLEKIKTIGDGYMIAAGVPVPREDHAEATADIALEMQQSIQRFNQENGVSLGVRIGIDSGPVVAGIIGTTRFIYDLWGDTVNTASRMESHGVAGQIQVSAAAYALLADRYAFEERGVIEVKGKGKMQTYLLTGVRPGRGGRGS